MNSTSRTNILLEVTEMTTLAYIAILMGAASCSAAVMRLVSLFERPDQFQRRRGKAAA